MRPSVGLVMRLRILRSVLLPAPFRPMMPTTSPLATSKLKSFSAQNSSLSDAAAGPRVDRRKGAVNARVSASRNVTPALRSRPMIYCFERCSTLIAMGFLACMIDRRVLETSALTSNDIGEPALNSLKICDADEKQTHRHAGG